MSDLKIWPWCCCSWNWGQIKHSWHDSIHPITHRNNSGIPWSLKYLPTFSCSSRLLQDVQVLFQKREKTPNFFQKPYSFAQFSGIELSVRCQGAHWDNLTKEKNFKISCTKPYVHKTEFPDTVLKDLPLFWALNQILPFMLQPYFFLWWIFKIPSNPGYFRILILSHISCLFSGRLVSSPRNLW